MSAALAPGPLLRPVQASTESLRQLAYAHPAAFPVLLDSSALGALGRYSILAAYPQAALWLDAAGLQAQASGPHVVSDAAMQYRSSPTGFLDALQEAWRSEAAAVARAAGAAGAEGAAAGEPADYPGPFHGGWMVFLGYELAAQIEPQLSLPPPPPGAEWAPAALALRIPAALVFDHRAGRAWLIAEAGRHALLADLQAALAALPQQGAVVSASASLPALALQEEAPERFRDRVQAALEYIRAGDIYQANLSRPWRGEFAADRVPPPGLAATLYERLRAANPAPFAALAQHRGWSLLCSSPERLVRVADGRVETRPIAGTRPRSRTAGADESELAALIAHPKERAEHIMLVDLERNDLGRICQPGSVLADPIMVTESYAHVHHIVSNVSGRLREGLTPVEVLRAVFPGGTITGCPKFRCMQIIAELEAESRGAYTGAIGFINHDGSMDLNILIRSLTLTGRRLQFRAGGGIVADSDWQRELAETRAKARGLLTALDVPPA
ncbi:MAG TPA: aminodeoxychorismate synthase component I [Steroidobacteraceae bacterium]|jgi:anthranilate synthase component 1|nr:aminodeoxychorismate synthase component I [Steroidobacteraceae bacterium]